MLKYISEPAKRSSALEARQTDGEEPSDHAGVHFPPPLIHGLGILLGIALGMLIPVLWATQLPMMELGMGLMVGALLLAGWGFRQFGLSKNPVPPNAPINGLMLDGPFRYTRNPLYVALALLHIGIGLVSANVWILLAVVPALLLVRFYVIAREEAYLIRRFGKAYLDYRARVRRWV